MQPMNIEQAIHIALQQVESNRLADGEKLLRQILALHPDHPGALHLLGAIALRVGRSDAAVELIRRAAEQTPNAAEGFGHLGDALTAAGKLDEAAAMYRRAIQVKPNYPE